MKIHFTGRNIEVTAALKKFTTEKMERIQRRFPNVEDVHVTFHVENILQIAEASLESHGTEIHASAKSEDLYAAIDELVDKLLLLLTKQKEKMTDHHR